MQVLTPFCPASNTIPTLSFPCRGSFHNTEEKHENMGHKSQSCHHHFPLSTLALPFTLSPHTRAPQRFPLSHASPIPPMDPGPDLADDRTTEPSAHFSTLAAMPLILAHFYFFSRTT